MAWEDVLGLIGGGLITVSFVPQIVRLYRLKSAREISLLFNALLMLGSVCWMSYGVALDLFPVVLWNAMGFVLLCTMMFAKFKYSK